MLFRTGPVFQPPAGIAEIEMRHGIGRALLEAGFIGRARLLVLLFFQEIVPGGKLLGSFIKGFRSHRVVRIKPQQYGECKDCSHEPSPHLAEELSNTCPHNV